MTGCFEYDHSQPLLQAKSQWSMPSHRAHTTHSTFAEQTTQTKHAIKGSTRQKKTPPKAGFLGFSLGVLPCFHSVKKPSSQMNLGSEIPLSKSRRISWLTDLRNLLSMCLANSSQGLAPHTPEEGFVAFFFYA